MILFIKNKEYMDSVLGIHAQSTHKGAFKELKNQITANAMIPKDLVTWGTEVCCSFYLVRCDIDKDLFVYEFLGTNN